MTWATRFATLNGLNISSSFQAPITNPAAAMFKATPMPIHILMNQVSTVSMLASDLDPPRCPNAPTLSQDACRQMRL